MPAVVAFSIYASIAIFFDFILQTTLFSTLMVLDGKRTSANRIDCFPCTPPPNLDLNTTVCTVEWIGYDWNCLTLGLISSYTFILVFGTIGIIIGTCLIHRKYRTTNHHNYSNIHESNHSSYSAINSNLEHSPSQRSTHGSNITPVSSGNINLTESNKGLLHKYWMWHAKVIVRYPALVILASLIFIAICGVGIMKIQIEQNPEKLWVPSDSRAALDEAYFNDKFGPFFRTEQLIFTPKIKNDHMLQLSYLNQLLDIQDQVVAINISYNKQYITLNDLCYKVSILYL